MVDKGGIILLTGATGYVGGRLLRALVNRRESVRCLARRPELLASRLGPNSHALKGDLLDPSSLGPAMEGVNTAYYLVHSMAADSFEQKDRQAAGNFAEAAKAAGVRKIIYLGGLSHGTGLSPHLESRLEVGLILKRSGVPTIEFRASIIIGEGSLSFEMVKALVNRLPMMITPRWVSTLSQPISIEDVIDYLVAALDLETESSLVFEIGGSDRVSYRGIMEAFARVSKKTRLMIPVPVLTPWLSSLWLGLVTPLQARVGRKLIEGVKNESVVRDPSALEVFTIRPRGIEESIRLALSG